MKKTIIAMQLLTLLVIVAACTQTTESVKPEAAPRDGKVEPTHELPGQIDALIPQMASDDVAQRQQAQKTFDMMCLTAARPDAEPERIEICGEILRRLGPETPQRARVWMIRQLERVGRDECLERLAELLGDNDALIRETARRALQHNSSANVRPVLELALEQTDTPEWQIALINALAARREAESLPVFCDWAQRPEADVAAAATAALGEIGGDQAIQTLYTLWRADDPAVQNRAAAALLRLAEQLVESGDRELGIQIFDDLYLYGDSEPTRLAALRGSTLAKGPAAVVPLLEIMRDGEPESALRAARLAVEIPGEAVTLTLAMMMADMPPAVQAALLEGLGPRGDATARSAAINGAHSSDEIVRIAALTALQDLGNSSDVILLAHIAATTSAAERDAARQTLDRLPGAEVDEIILKAAQEQADVPIRCELIRSLAARYYYPAIPALLAASSDDAVDVQIAAFEALASLARPEHLPELVARLAEQMTEQAREAAENAVVTTALRIDDADQRADALLTALPESSKAARASLVRALGRIGGERALQAIRANYPSLEPEVADAAVRALANWPTPEVLSDLLMIARMSSDEAHPVLALRGYVRLVRLPSDRTAADTFLMLEEAMAIATRPDEKKLVLGGLADVPLVDALMTAEVYLGDQALCNEAAVTMLTVARALAADQPDAASAAIKKVQAAPTNDRVQQQATEIAEFIDRFAGYGAAWLLAGPYTQEGKSFNEIFDITFPPETQDAPDVDWNRLPVNNRDNPWIFDLAQALGGGNRCAYVKTTVRSETQQTVNLELGSDDAVKVWLNGTLVHGNLVHRAVAPAQDTVEVTLNQGNNALMLKVVQGGGDWGFCAGFRAPDGGPVTGVSFHPE